MWRVIGAGVAWGAAVGAIPGLLFGLFIGAFDAEVSGESGFDAGLVVVVVLVLVGAVWGGVSATCAWGISALAARGGRSPVRYGATTAAIVASAPGWVLSIGYLVGASDDQVGFGTSMVMLVLVVAACAGAAAAHVLRREWERRADFHWPQALG